MSGPTDAEVVEAFQRFLEERAQAGVAIARAVSSVSFASGEVIVVFDASVPGYEEWALRETAAFDNWADFAGAPIAFSNPEGDRLRLAVSRVTTFMDDGKPLGSRSAAELYKQGTGTDL